MTADRNIKFLKDITELIGSVADIENLLKILVITATRVLEVKAASLILHDPKSDKLYFHVAVGDGKEDVKRYELDKGEGIAGWVFEHGLPLLAPDVSADPRWSPRIANSIGMNTRSIACAPLIAKGKTIGVMEIIDHENGEPLCEADMESLYAFASLAATAVEEANARLEVESENRSLRAGAKGRWDIIGKSPAMERAKADCMKAASSKATTLITGESGTGKELFARLIHENSPRRDQRLVVVNCGALPETLLERELFGHEKGAFTGADSRKPGLFETADKGSIFLDEIGDTSPAMQIKLLRVLQEGNFMRIGGQAQINVDVRVIAATNQLLEKLVSEKKFREDLYYRLNVIRVHLPPIRERKEDIPMLIEHFREKAARKMGRGIKSYSPEASDALLAFSWPGNVRQMENAIERAAIMCEGGEIRLEDLPPEIGAIKTGDIQAGGTLKDALTNFKKKFIIQSLSICDGNRTAASRLLDIQRTYLSRLIKELGIDV
jgi:Nif-specific regulatory protein